MHIERIDIEGYQHLRGSWELHPRMTVITGPNEAGKSTLQEALRIGLFGFLPEERRRQRGHSHKDVRRPWDGSPFGLTLHLVDRENRRVRLAWDLEHERVVATEADTGVELLRETPLQRAHFQTGPRFLGITRAEHDQLGCLVQGELAPVKATESLTQALREAVEATASSEGGARAADARLAEMLSRLGVHGGHYGPTPSGRLARLRASIGDLERKLDLAYAARDELDRLTAEGTTLENEARLLERRIAAAERSALTTAADRFREACEAAHAMQCRLADSADAGPALPAELPGRIATARERWRKARQELDSAVQEADRGRPRVQAARAALREAQAAVDDLAPYAEVDASAEDAVRAALATLQGLPAAGPPPQAPQPRDPQLERFRARRGTSAPPVAATASGASTALLAGPAALGAVGVVAGVVMHPAAFVLVAVAIVITLLARRPTAPLDPPDAAEHFEGRPVADLAALAAAEDRRWLEHEAALAAHRQLVGAAATRRGAAVAALGEALGEPSPDLDGTEASARQYLRQCERRRAYEHRAGELARAREAARLAGRSDDEAATARTVLEGSEAELRRLLTGAGVSEGDLDAGLRAFDDLAAADAERRAAGVARAAMAGRLEQLLAGRTIEQLEEQASEARASLRAHMDRLGDLPVAGGSRVDVDELRRLRLDAVEGAAGLAARREEREASLGDVADLELRVDAYRRELETLELSARAVRIAREELAAAAGDAHRRVAPYLNAALQRSLPVITRGRYRDAMVADDLSIRVLAPGAREPVDVERLSRGTRDQIALVQRLELARLMDPTGGGAPLLLDDCFAHTDLHRLPIAASLLGDVARHRQVVLCSDDPDVVEAVVDAAVDAAVIQLPDPVVDVPILSGSTPDTGYG